MNDRSLLDLAGFFSEPEAEEIRDAIRESDERWRSELDRLADRLDP